jgi:hypothetical protein
MQNLLMFSGGMGFSILGLLFFGVGRCFFYMMLFGGISRHIGWWSEFCLRFSIVFDVNVVMFEAVCWVLV